ncbi:MAG: response regulator [Campylobacterota bacterium]|nr:response regulator [Campylobacterota bacterium]
MKNRSELTEEAFEDILLECEKRLNEDFTFSETVLEYEKRVKEITSAQEAFVLLLNSKEKNFHIVSKQIDIPISAESSVEGILFESFYSKKPYIATHARRNFLYRKNIDNFIDAKINDILVVPIFDHSDTKNIIAIVWIATTDANREPFTQKDIDYINRFSIAIHAKITANDQNSGQIAVEDDKDITKESLIENDTSIINILIVDNSVIILRFLEAVLHDYSINIITAESGIEAIERFKHKKIDLIFMDEIMAGMSGHEAIQVIRQIEKEKEYDRVPIFGLTSDTSRETKEKLLESGANLVLYKPIDVDHIIQTIQKFATLSKLPL